MSSRAHVNQSSACSATAEYLDENNKPFVPALVKYKVDDISNGRNVVPYTDIAGPGISSRVTITSEQNAMLAAHLRETRRITFEVTAPGGDIQYPFAEYDLVRTSPLDGDPP
jgi:hypothetical protein